jgi:hypothetical protein
MKLRLLASAIGVALLAPAAFSADPPESKMGSARALREAIAFERAKERAAERQLRIERRAGRSETRDADRSADRSSERPKANQEKVKDPGEPVREQK